MATNTHLIFQPLRMASQDVVSFDRSIVSTSDLDNGNLIIEATPSTTTYGITDLIDYISSAPSDVDKNVVLIVDSGEVGRIGGEFRINTADPRYNYVPAGVTARARMLTVGDEFAVSSGAFASAPTVGQFAIPANSSLQFAPSATQTGARLICKVISTWTFSVGKTNVAGYRLKVVNA